MVVICAPLGNTQRCTFDLAAEILLISGEWQVFLFIDKEDIKSGMDFNGKYQKRAYISGR